MKKSLFMLLLATILLPAFVYAESIEEKDFAIEVPEGFTYKGQLDGYNTFGTADGKQRLDINTLSELVAGTNAAYLFETLAKQSGYRKSKELSERRAGRYCGFGVDGKSFLMVLADKNNLKICVVIYRWSPELDEVARKNITEYLIYSHSLDRSFTKNSSTKYSTN